MPIFLERVVLSAIATIVAAIFITLLLTFLDSKNLIDISWQIRGAVVAVMLAIGSGVAWWLYRHDQFRAPQTGPPITLPDGRVLIRQPPTSLMALCKNLMGVEAERKTDSYVGHWLKVTGYVHDIQVYSRHDRTIDVWLKLPPARSRKFCRVRFESESWGSHVSLLGKGDKLTALGKISFILEESMMLTEGELVADD
jgi:hypothetical protein